MHAKRSLFPLNMGANMKSTLAFVPKGSLIAAALLFGGPTPVFADADCQYSISDIQSEANGSILVRFNATWHVLASATHVGRADRLSLAIAAKLSGKRMVITYPGTYSCSATDYGIVPTKVRLAD